MAKAKDYAEQKKKFMRARMKLLADHPFFGDLAYQLPIIWDDTLNPPTAATNGKYIKFHPAFVDTISHEELVFLIAHEVMHPALMHILRRGNRDPHGWNVACDIVVNQLLIESGVGKMPNGGIQDWELYHKGEGKADKIYDLLPEQEYGAPGSGGVGGNGSLDAMEDVADGDKEATAADWRNKLQSAVQTAKAAGKLPGSIEQFVENMTNPKVAWQDKLRNFVMTTRGSDRTWAKPNRRYLSSGISLPGTYGETMGELVFAIDCSGSTSDEMVGQCGGEIASIQEELRPEKIHVLYFDTEVKKHEEFEPDDPLQVKVHGRGGTCFRTIFEYIDKAGISPENVVVATDLYCHDFGPKPDYPVMWCVMESCARKAPWGDILVVD